MGSNLVSWSSKKQRTVAHSSTKAEYKSLANTAVELSWLQIIFGQLCIYLNNPPVIWCDNIGATYLAVNPVFHARTKHIKIDFHFVREKVVKGMLKVRYVSTTDQISDIFTKALRCPCFRFLLDKLTVLPAPSAYSSH